MHNTECCYWKQVTLKSTNWTEIHLSIQTNFLLSVFYNSFNFRPSILHLLSNSESTLLEQNGFLPFICFTSFRERDKADINSLQWLALVGLVGLEPTYSHMWVAALPLCYGRLVAHSVTDV